MPAYLEPRTDVPAKDDWSTRLILRDTRGANTEVRVTGLIAAVTFTGGFFLPATAGNVVAMVVLGVLVLLSLVAPLTGRSEARAQRSGLLDELWRRLPAAVARSQDDDPYDRVLLDGMVLKGWFHDLPAMVVDQREVFVCGPDAEGRAMIRAAGFAAMRPAEVETGEYQAAERVERPLGRPRDEPGVQEVLRSTGWISGGVLALMTAILVLIGVLVALSVSPVVPTGLVAAALLVTAVIDYPLMVVTVRRNRDLVRAVERSEQWTPVPIRMFGWRRGHHVAGIAELPEGPALVRFPVPTIEVVANVAHTGVMWVAGTHRGVLAVGVPGLNSLTYAVVREHRAAQQGDPMSWLRRIRQQDLSDLPG